MPSNPADAKGLLLASIENNDPVIFLENLHLYRSLKGEVPEGYYTTPLDQAAVAKEGSDVSIIAYGGTVPLALKAAEQLEKMESKLKLLTLELLLLLTSHQSVKQLKNWTCCCCSRSSTYRWYCGKCNG